ncbi:MAG: DUF4962 domain-containing protein [Methyloprofundus sp.]|nr:DUF4962 domain-containing protein [Methyloprofundus sp.]
MNTQHSEKTATTNPPAPAHGFVKIACCIYLALLIYGTLFPIDEWDWAQGDLGEFFTLSLPEHVSKADLVMNIIVYTPLGFLAFLLISNHKSHTATLLWTTLAGFSLSFTLEFLQQFLPLRVTSLSDIFLNTASTFIGALLAYYLNRDAFQTKLEHWQYSYVSDKPYSLLGITSIGLWAAAQLTPFVPSIELSYLRHGVAPIWKTLNNLELFNYAKFTIQALYLSSIAVILRTSLTRNTHSSRLIILFLSTVLILKIPILSRQLSLESILGLIIALSFLLLTYQIPFRKLKFITLLFALAGYAYSTLLAGTLAGINAMNWVPFAQQMNTLVGIGDLIEQIAIFSAISFLIIQGNRNQQFTLLWGSVFVLFFAFGLEWYQQHIPGRYSDITDVVIAIGTWFFCALYPWNTSKKKTLVMQADLPNNSSPQPKSTSKIVYIIPIALIGLITAFFAAPTKVVKGKYKLPEIADLPAAHFPYFKTTHPRLPAPSYDDVISLTDHNKNFFRRHRDLAKRGKLYSRTLIARIFPGEIDIYKLFSDLMALKFSWRGHQQTKPLALAYDWLYEQWTPEQRIQLREKVKSACEYQIKVINKEALSPYNVYLYNSPFQAMVAAALAVHTDIPAAEDKCMRFTHDYWMNRALPVWQQIMGKNGGWHEGGEYVGVGIGQAIYQVPAMWRSATGQDLFKTESGIKGFLDFLIYRTRPDGTHMRWGDSLFFDRKSPDKTALAIEYKHKAAYSLGGCPKPFNPSLEPWGPLTTDVLCDPQSINKMPLARHFDGIGMVMARSDWTSEATYVVFKAGNNYWSHSHLDQGAFTIYKGGPLAIDSGLYGPRYGSDHHMNYSYQSIAHNVITVTDNNDNLLLPDKKDKKKFREIANDGGQRRIGSGWGKSAPMDLTDWLNKKDTYQAGKITKYYADGDFVIAIADLTAAYTNKKSGSDTFRDRTRRVERYWRTFVYDRTNDIILIFDNITAANANFTKRSIFHTINQPYLHNNKVVAQTYYREKYPTQKGGTLEATILFPKQAFINIVGGKNKKFLVQNKNYDENGGIDAYLKKRDKNSPELGAWRVEVIPPLAQQTDYFLTVYNPKLPGEDSNINIEAIESDTEIGSKINGASLSYRIFFSKQQENLRIKFEGSSGRFNIEL